MPHISNQIIAVFHHVSVGTNDSGPFRNCFHSRWVERTIETGRCWRRPVIRMVGQQQSERHLRVALLCCLDTLCRQRIKAAISAYNKVCHAIFGYVALNLTGISGRRLSGASRCPMKKQIDILIPPLLFAIYRRCSISYFFVFGIYPIR